MELLDEEDGECELIVKAAESDKAYREIVEEFEAPEQKLAFTQAVLEKEVSIYESERI